MTMNYLFVIAILALDIVPLDNMTSSCTRLELSSTNLQRPEGTDIWSSFVCGFEQRRAAVLASPTEATSKGNCIYRSITIGHKFDGEWEADKYQGSGYMIARMESDGCPSIDSARYTPVNPVHAGDDRESVYIDVYEQIKRLTSDRSDIDETLSSIPFLERMFDSTYRDFKKFVESDCQSGGLVIEAIDRDFRGDGYLVLVRAGNEVWTLTFSKEKEGLRITDVSKTVQ